MRISARCKYALLAVLEMSKAPTGSVLKVADIAAGPDIPPDYLVQVLIILKTAGIVESVRGKMGGYRLSRSPKTITVAEVIQAVEGRVEPTVGLRRVLNDLLTQADQAAEAVLSDTTFEDLCRQEREGKEAMSYSI
jgi:Rrf2 family protein